MKSSALQVIAAIAPGFPNITRSNKESQVTMSAIGWQGRFDESSTPEDVVDVCKDFLVLWTATELAELPLSCRLKESIDAQGVNPYALTLIRQLGIGDRATDPMLHRMSTFFTRAALRLAQINEQAVEVSSEHGKSRSRS